MGESLNPFAPTALLVPDPEIGLIQCWQGSVGSIPTGWLLCDGTNDTPDLRDKMIPGSQGIYAPGETGGNTTHNHTFLADGHDHSLPADFPFDSGRDLDSITSVSCISGSTQSVSNLPPYYSLCYIMFVGDS